MNLVKLNAYDGSHYLRIDLIKAISQCRMNLYLGSDVCVDVKSKIIYDGGEVYYFVEDIDTVVKMIEERG